MIKAAIKAFFAGGSAYAYLIGGGVIIGGWLYVDNLKSTNERLTTELAESRAAEKSKDATIASQSRQNARQGQNAKDLTNAEEAIRKAAETSSCSGSPAIIAALDGLRNKRATEAANRPDE